MFSNKLLKTVRRVFVFLRAHIFGTISAILGIILSTIAVHTTMDSWSFRACVPFSPIRQCIGKEAHEILFDKWAKETGAIQRKTVSALWYQFFEKGFILYIEDEAAYVLLHKGKTWRGYKTPDKPRISSYPKNEDEINFALLRHLYGGQNYEPYEALFKNFVAKDKFGLTGGIGNLYVLHDLFPILGQPLHREKHAYHSAFYDIDSYRLILGVPGSKDHHCKSWSREVVKLLQHNTETSSPKSYEPKEIRVKDNIFHLGECTW